VRVHGPGALIHYGTWGISQDRPAADFAAGC